MCTLRMIFLFSWLGEGKKAALASIGCTSNISGRKEGGREGGRESGGEGGRKEGGRRVKMR